MDIIFERMAVHINIGSNLGDSLALTSAAVARLAAVLPGRAMRVSEPFRSPAWGYSSDRGYINTGVMFEGSEHWSDEELQALYGAIHAVETDLGSRPHRNADGSYRDRDLDIDIIDVDGIVARTPSLVLPHPRMHLRPFVLIPLLELDPGWRHPLLGRTGRDLLLSIK